MPWNPKEYPPDWDARRDRIMARAGEVRDAEGAITTEARCERCGVENHCIGYRHGSRWITKPVWDHEYYHARHNGETHRRALWLITQGAKKLSQIVLTIAHVNHDKANWDVADEELAAWCQRCHLAHDRNHHEANRKYGRNHGGEHQFKLDI